MSDLTCSMCGHRFDPAGHEGCAACPLQKSCLLVRCPNCGYEMTNPEHSILARAASRFFRFFEPKHIDPLISANPRE